MGRPPTGIGKATGLRLYPALEERLDKWIEAQPDPKPSRPAAMRRLIERGLDAFEAGKPGKVMRKS